ncbi:MAG: hypothetical protein ACI95C_000349 [Pseudohongiellaceae bacterium]|jgi:hypothetical protein
MRERVSELVDKIAKLETQLFSELRAQQEEFSYKLKGKKIEFEQAVLEAHQSIKVAILPWLLSSGLRTTISIPFIYGMIIPIAFIDLTITLYQHICFRLYDITRVNRGKYIVLDRHQLAYLNGIEKFNCLYCSYGNGVIAYSREVIARTEQYWCPIKHARRTVGTHKRYSKFLSYGDGQNYPTQLLKFREDLKQDD